MKPLEIRIALLRKGHTGSSVARDLGLAQTTVSNVMHGYTWSSRVTKRIAALTGIPVAKLFPGGSAAVNARRAA